MSANGNREVIEGFVNAASEGTDAQVRYVHEDCVFHEAECLPWGGDFWGPAGLIEFTGIMVSAVEVDLRSVSYLDAGEKVAAEMMVCLTSKRSGESVTMKAITLFELRAGQIIDASAYYKDASVLAGLV